MLRIRPYKPADAEYVLHWLTDERTVAFWKADRFSWPLTKEQLDAYNKDFTEDPYSAAFTVLDEEGDVIGHFSLRKINWKENRAHMGFLVVNPECRGKGYGRQMVHQALLYAFQVLGLKRVTLGVYECNEPARRCYEAEGFRRLNDSGDEAKTEVFHGEVWKYVYLEAQAEGGMRNE